MKRVLGGILMAIGILIAGVSGLCSGFFLVSMAGTRVGFGPDPVGLMLILLFGGLPFAGGVAMILGGRALTRRAREEDGD